jgi:hypothetical protein
VRIALQQSAPEHIAEWVLSGKTDIGIATEGLSPVPGPRVLPLLPLEPSDRGAGRPSAAGAFAHPLEDLAEISADYL